LIIGLSNVFGIQVLIPFKQERAMLLAACAGSVLSIAICLVLCPVYKQHGAAWACLTAEAAVTGIAYFFARKLNSFRLPAQQWIPVLICSFLFVPLIYVARNLFTSQLNILLGSAFACGITYLLLQLFIFSNTIVKEIVNFVWMSTAGFFKR
jgi:O-antigen/teichoic acid export membrane protein